MSKLSIIIPVYYNEGELLPLYDDLNDKVLKSLVAGGDTYEIIMVDDGSKDNSWLQMLEIVKKDLNVHLYHLSRNFGEYSAILCGLSKCTGDCAVIKAADMQEPSELILDMFQKWKQGYRVVLATREKREEGVVQRMFANTYYWLTRKIIFPQMPKGGFNIYLLDRRAITVLLNMDETNMVLEGQILWSGFKTTSVSYIRKAREIGKSRWTMKKKVKAFLDMIFTNSDVPIQFVGIIGIMTFVFALVMTVYILLKWITVGEQVIGWTSLFVLVIMAFGVIMITLSILGNYMWRCFESVKNKPVFIVEDAVNEVKSGETDK